MARGRKTSVVLDITPEQRQILTQWQRSTTIRAGLANRGRIILLLADGASISQISRAVDIRRRFIYKWAERFRTRGIEGLYDKAGRGRPLFFHPMSRFIWCRWPASGLSIWGAPCRRGIVPNSPGQ